MSDNEIKPIQTWAIVELMGHVKSAGMVSEETHFGTVLLRLDVPASDGNQPRTEFYGGSSIYRLTPCTEEVAMLVLKRSTPVQIVPYELPRPKFGQPELIEQDDDE
jgi:hypothetical protein